MTTNHFSRLCAQLIGGVTLLMMLLELRAQSVPSVASTDKKPVISPPTLGKRVLHHWEAACPSCGVLVQSTKAAIRGWRNGGDADIPKYIVDFTCSCGQVFIGEREGAPVRKVQVTPVYRIAPTAAPAKKPALKSPHDK